MCCFKTVAPQYDLDWSHCEFVSLMSFSSLAATAPVSLVNADVTQTKYKAPTVAIQPHIPLSLFLIIGKELLVWCAKKNISVALSFVSSWVLTYRLYPTYQWFQ